MFYFLALLLLKLYDEMKDIENLWMRHQAQFYPRYMWLDAK